MHKITQARNKFTEDRKAASLTLQCNEYMHMLITPNKDLYCNLSTCRYSNYERSAGHLTLIYLWHTESILSTIWKTDVGISENILWFGRRVLRTDVKQVDKRPYCTVINTNSDLWTVYRNCYCGTFPFEEPFVDR